MKFTTSCFVRVEDVDKRNELIRWCENVIGRNGGFPVGADWIIGEFVLCIRDITYCCRHEELIFLTDDTTIDCGENIDQFKALAAMNDENDQEQWFTNGRDWGVFRSTPPPEGYEHWGNTEGIEFFGLPDSMVMENYRKATAAEIVEYFNRE